MLSQFNGAVMDSERRHRFLLWRFWSDEPRMLFIGLNPSTANELTDDPTVRRLCDFAQGWGYGGLYACNLYSQVTPYPKELLPETRNHGANTPAIQMAVKFYDMLESPMCWGLTASGNPKHPLYLPGDAELEELECV